MSSTRAGCFLFLLVLAALSAGRPALAADASDTAVVLETAKQQLSAGQTTQAVATLTRHLKTLQSQLPQTGESYLRTTDLLASVLLQQRNAPAANELRKECVQQFEAAKAARDLVGRARLSWARQLSGQDAAVATKQFELAIQELTGALGSDARPVIHARLYFGFHLTSVPDHAAAAKLWSDLSPITEHVAGRNSLEHEIVLSQWGAACQQLQDYPQATQVLKQALEVCRARRMSPSEEEGQILENLGMVAMLAGDHPAARDHFFAESAVFRGLLGPEHRRTAWARAMYGDQARQAGPRDQARNALDQAQDILDRVVGKTSRESRFTIAARVMLAENEVRFEECERLIDDWIQREQEAEGRVGLQTALARSHAAILARLRGDFRQATERLQRLVTDFEPLSPVEAVAKSGYLGSLATTAATSGDQILARESAAASIAVLKAAGVLTQVPQVHAERLVEWAQVESAARSTELLAEARRVLQDSGLAKTVLQARLHQAEAKLAASVGDDARAASLAHEASNLYRDLLGERDPQFLSSLGLVSAYHRSAGNLDQAAEVAKLQVQLLENAKSAGDPEVIQALSLLASLEADRGRLDVADALANRAEQQLQQAGRTQSKEQADILFARGGIAARQGQVDQAISTLDRCAALCSELGLPGLRLSALSLKSAAYQNGLRLDLAAQSALQAYAEVARVTGERSPAAADALSRRAQLAVFLQDHKAAVNLAQEALQLRREWLDVTLDALSERQQLTALKEFHEDLSLLLRIPRRAAPDTVYAEVLSWKGAAFMRQRMLRSIAASSDSAHLVQQLRGVSQDLAIFSRSSQDLTSLTTAEFARLRELQSKREQLSTELARRSGGIAVRTSPEDLLQQLRETLAEDAVLVDFVEYTSNIPQPTENVAFVGRDVTFLDAFVVSNEAEPQRIHLGQTADIAKDVKAWRNSLAQPPGASNARIIEGMQTGIRVRNAIWQPLQDFLPSDRIVLLSPDGLLSGLPFEALPGLEPGRYLLEERPLALAPVSQLLASREPNRPPNVMHDFLLVGGVDFGSPALRDGRGDVSSRKSHYLPLPGSLKEIDAIQAVLPPGSRVARLTDATASRDAVLAALPQAGVIHLATHGYFRPLNGRLSDDRRSYWDPGLQSGLVMALANEASNSNPAIINALDLAGVDLSGTSMVVLSGCETGLGVSAGGEGLLGLQRGFQAAGAKSVVASLWPVSDQGTQRLMTEFYNNLTERKLPKGEALRQAQLTMLNGYDPQNQTLTRGEVKKLAPLKPTDPKPTESGQPDRCPPYYWAGFVLSGDWR